MAPDDGTAPDCGEFLSYSAAGWGARAVEWRAGVLRAGLGHLRAVANPSPEEWRHFWDLADRVGAWDWRGDYSQGIDCGTPWVLRMRHGGREMACTGNGTGGEAPPGFAALYHALMGLVRPLPASGVAPGKGRGRKGE